MSKTSPWLRTISLRQAQEILDGGVAVIPWEAFECKDTTEEIALILLELNLMQQAKEVCRRFLSGFAMGGAMFGSFFRPILLRHRKGELPLKRELTKHIKGSRNPKKTIERLFPRLSDELIDRVIGLAKE